jgi:hypothetical protein
VVYTTIETDILEALRSEGGWVRPSDLDVTRDPRRYTALRKLVKLGRVERRGLPGAGARGAYEYRARNI